MAATYLQQRTRIETYFDRTAAEAWRQLTSDAPVSGIRANVRAGRDRMRALLLGWLPEDLHGRRLLDAGCGTGALAVEAARRGAEVVAIDLSANLVNVARDRTPAELAHRITYQAGDMLDPAVGRFDHIVGMDSLIHYRQADALRVVAGLAKRADVSMIFTFAPSTPALTLKRAVGKLFPRNDRSPEIVPVSAASFMRALAADPAVTATIGRTERVKGTFYTSQALELLAA